MSPVISSEAFDDLSLAFRRGPTFKYESHIHPLMGGPYDWHLIDGRLTLVKRPPAPEETP